MTAPTCIFKHCNYWIVRSYWPSDQGLKAQSVTFIHSSGAFAYWLSIEKKIVREQKAFSKLQQVNELLLTIQEFEFIKKLQKSKCLNITKRQYGYLSGIAERQGV